MAVQTTTRWPMGAPPSAEWFALSHAVREWRPDFVIEVARKMPRMDEALGLNLASLATTVSDYAIPFCPQFIRGARVAVIDDSVNVGSTISRAVRALLALGAAEVRPFALYSREQGGLRVNGAQPLQLVADDPFDHRMWRELAAQAPMVISRLNKPYDLDFPVIPCDVTAPFTGAADLYAYLEEQFQGRVFDVTTGAGRELGMFRFSVDLGTVEGIFEKVRFYYDETSAQLNVVPMSIATPLPTTPSEGLPVWARDMYNTLTATLPDGEAEARARSVMFVQSLVLGIDFLAGVAETVQPREPGLIDVLEAEQIFGPLARTLTIAADLIEDASARDRFARFADISGAVADIVAPASRETTTSPAWEKLWPCIADDVLASGTDPLIRAVVTFEALARAVGSENTDLYALEWPFTAEAIRDDEYQRLRVGFTAADLRAIFRTGANTLRSREGWIRTTSKVLDRLIDAGMVVPTIAEYDGNLYRVYRKGEAEPRDETIDRILLAMDEYGDGMSPTRLSKIGVITAFAVPTASSAHVSTLARGNVLALDADLLDDSTEIANFLRRTGKIVSGATRTSE